MECLQPPAETDTSFLKSTDFISTDDTTDDRASKFYDEMEPDSGCAAAKLTDSNGANCLRPNGCIARPPDDDISRETESADDFGSSSTNESNCLKTTADASSINEINLGVARVNLDTPEPSSNGVTASVKQESTASKVPSDELSPSTEHESSSNVRYVVYESERQMEDIMRLITNDLSEPYSIYTYRYFIHNWPRLCYLVCSLSCYSCCAGYYLIRYCPVIIMTEY